MTYDHDALTVSMASSTCPPSRSIIDVADPLYGARDRVVRATSSLVFMQGSISVGDREVVTASALIKIVEVRAREPSA